MLLAAGTFTLFTDSKIFLISSAITESFYLSISLVILSTKWIGSISLTSIIHKKEFSENGNLKIKRYQGTQHVETFKDKASIKGHEKR